MKRMIWLLALCGTAVAAPPFAERTKFVVDAWAHPKGGAPLHYAQIAARLKLHEDAALCSRRLEELLAEGPTGDMFWMFPITAIAYLDQGQLTPAALTPGSVRITLPEVPDMLIVPVASGVGSGPGVPAPAPS